MGRVGIWELANPPPFYPQTLCAHGPFAPPPPPCHLSPLPPAQPSSTPPMALNFVDGLGYTINRDILSPDDCKTAWGRVKKIWGGWGEGG